MKRSIVRYTKIIFVYLFFFLCGLTGYFLPYHSMNKRDAAMIVFFAGIAGVGISICGIIGMFDEDKEE